MRALDGRIDIHDLAHDNGGSDYVTVTNRDRADVTVVAQAFCLAG